MSFFHSQSTCTCTSAAASAAITSSVGMLTHAIIEQEVEKIFISRKHNKPYHNQNRIFSPTDTTTSSYYYYLLITNKLAHKHSSNNMKFMPLSLNVFLLLGVGAISCSWARSEPQPQLREGELVTSTSDAAENNALLRGHNHHHRNSIDAPTATKLESFQPAKSLDFFRNIDEKKFKWVNKAEIHPGGVTCGFLKAPLLWPKGTSGWPAEGEDDAYPIVDVYVCVKFAAVQPAPRGNIVVHEGGPGTLSSAVYGFGKSFGQAVDTYNIIGIDQRGMGRSTPTQIRKECNLGEYGMDDASSDLDLTDEASIRAFAQVFKKRNLNCWRHPDFHLTSGSVNNAKNYHFLEYSGTRQLAEDIERVRILFGRQKISLFGCSYGTTVVGTYSTIFPHHVHLVVLDGSTLPFPDVHENSEDRARSANQRIDYFV
eukprot:scaffold241_cov120-Skeletonema_marinoi.AAC.6